MRNSKADQMEGRESMSVPAVAEHLVNDPLRQSKVDLAAAHRLAVMYDFEEGIDNHFSVTVPGHDDLFLILPFGLHWAEARASDMIVFDESGTVVDGEGVVELSAYCIHAPIHRITGARVVFHTHQTWALALNMLEDNRIIPARQTSAYFHGRVAYDDAYSGTADFTAEGDRLAEVPREGRGKGAARVPHVGVEALECLLGLIRPAQVQIHGGLEDPQLRIEEV